MAYAASHLDRELPLAELARHAGLSQFHLHRLFSAAAGETPKHYTLRLRLGRAAVLLLTTPDSILDIALSCGFQNHETFSRAFRRRFRMTPRAYRARGLVNGGGPYAGAAHAAVIAKAGPCIGLYHTSGNEETENERLREDMSYSITKKQLDPQPVLLVRRRIKRSEIAATIAEALGQVFQHAQRSGIALEGLPFTRYSETGPGFMTIEPGMRIAGGGSAAGEGEVVADTLPGGPAAMTLHIGPYDKLSDAYAAVEAWIEAQGLKPTGAPWECYLTDPTEHPDPMDWKTEVYWPVKEA